MNHYSDVNVQEQQMAQNKTYNKPNDTLITIQ